MPEEAVRESSLSITDRVNEIRDSVRQSPLDHQEALMHQAARSVFQG